MITTNNSNTLKTFTPNTLYKVDEVTVQDDYLKPYTAAMLAEAQDAAAAGKVTKYANADYTSKTTIQRVVDQLASELYNSHRALYKHFTAPMYAAINDLVEAEQKAKFGEVTLKVTPEAIEVGTIMHGSWGYDQTNNEFGVVVKVTKSSLWVVSLDADFEAEGFMHGLEVVDINGAPDYTKEVKMCRMPKGSGLYINAPFGHGVMSPWDGKAKYSSSYA